MNKKQKEELRKFLEEEFDNMIKYADWRRGDKLKMLLATIKQKSRGATGFDNNLKN